MSYGKEGQRVSLNRNLYSSNKPGFVGFVINKGRDGELIVRGFKKYEKTF